MELKLIQGMKGRPLMDRKTFLLQLKRLESCFGNQHREVYNQDRGELIWREVNQLSDEWMVKITDLFIGEFDRPPLMPQFREQISKERERLWMIQKSNKMVLPENLSQYLCSDCDNSGRAWVDGAVFLCHCDHGGKRPEKFPRLVRSNLKAVGRG